MLDWRWEEEEELEQPQTLRGSIGKLAQEFIEALAVSPPTPQGAVTKPMPSMPVVEEPAEPPPTPTEAEPPQEAPEAIATPTPQETPEALAVPSPPTEYVPPLTYSWGSPETEALIEGLKEELGRQPTWRETIEAVRKAKYDQLDPIESVGKAIIEAIPAGINQLAKMVAGVVGLEDVRKALEEGEGFNPDIPPPDRWVRDLYEGVKSSVPSLTLMGLGALLRINPALVGAAIMGLYGHDRYKEVLDNAKAVGLDPDSPEVQRNAMIQGLIEGGTEALADIGIGKILRLFPGSPLRHVAGKDGIAAHVKEIAKTWGEIAAVEIPQETFTAAAEAYMDRQLGIPSPDPLTAAKMAVMPTFWSTLVFLGAGTINQRISRPDIPSDVQAVLEKHSDNTIQKLHEATQHMAEGDHLKATAALEQAEAEARTYANLTASPINEQREAKRFADVNITTPAALETYTGEHVLMHNRRQLWEMLRTALPGAEIIPKGAYGEKTEARLPNGVRFEVVWPANIKVNQSLPWLRGKVVGGFWSPMRKLMGLSGEYLSQSLVDEEAYHVAQTLVLTNAEVASEIRHFSGTNKPIHQMTPDKIREAIERSAAGYVQWVQNWRQEAPQHSNWVKIREWAGRLVRQVAGVYRPEDVWYKVATGRVWSRAPREVPLSVTNYGALLNTRTPDKRYVGAPPHIQSDDVYELEVQRLLTILREEVDPRWFYFYDEAANVVRELSDGNDKKADILMRLLAVTSAGSDVKTNVIKAVRAFMKYAHEGGDFIVPGLINVKMSDLVNAPSLDRLLKGANKVKTFYQNLVSAYYGTNDDGVTNDLWIARLLGYPGSHFSPAQYRFAQAMIQDVAERFNLETNFNLTPKHIQSGLWHWMRSREGRGDIYSSFKSALDELTARVAWEVFPGSEVMPKLQDVQHYFNRLASIIDKGDRNILLDTLLLGNPDKLATTVTGGGGWAGTHSPNLIASYVSDESVIDKISRQNYYPIALARQMAAATGYIYAQDGVAWFREISPTAAKHLTMGIKRRKPSHPLWFLHGQAIVIENVSPRGTIVPITQDQVNGFMASVWSEMETGYTLKDGVIYIANYRFPDANWGFFTETKDILAVVNKYLMPGWKAHITDIIGAVEGREIYEPNPEDPINPIPIPREKWLQDKLNPDQWGIIHNLHLEATQIYKEIQAQYPDVTLPEDALTAVVDDPDILDLTEEIPVHEKYVGSLNIPRFTDSDSIASVAKKLYLANQADIDAARRLMTWQEIVKAGESLGINRRTLAKFERQQALKREEMYALIKLNKWAVHNLLKAAKEYRALPSLPNLDKAKLAYDVAARIMRIYQAAATEWGYVGSVLAAQDVIPPLEQWNRLTPQQREALRQANPELDVVVRKGLAKTETLIRRVNRALGGAELSHEKITRLTQLITDPNTTERDIVKFVNDAAPAKLSDKVFTAWINSLFSLKTHAINATSNMLTLLLGPVTTATAGMLDAIESVATGKPREMFAQEGWEYALGTLTALPEAFKVALNTLITNIPAYGETKLETAKPEPFKSPVAKALFTHHLRLLQAADDFAKTLVYRGALRAKAFRLMRQIKPKNPAAWLGDVLTNPEVYAPEIHKEAMEEAIYRTFQAQSDLAEWLSKEPTGVLKWVIPFKRTLINIVKMGLEHTPVEAIALAAGKSIGGRQVTPLVAKEQAAKVLIGSSLLFMGYLLASRGILTGSGPSDQREREALYAAGWRPYSIKTRFGRIDYSRLEPLATLLGLIADTHSIITQAALPDAEVEKVITRAVTSISRNVLDKSMLTGLMKALLAATMPDRYGEKWWYGFVSSWIPGSVASVVRADDPTLRNPRNVLEAIKARLPIVSRDVAPVYDRWGNPVAPTKSLTFMERLISPMPVFTDTVHPIDVILLEKGIRIAPPQDSVRVKGVAVKLTPAQMEYLASARRQAYQALQRMAPRLERLPAEEAERLVRSTIQAHTKAARLKLLTDPTFLATLRTLEREGKLARMERGEIYRELVIH